MKSPIKKILALSIIILFIFVDLSPVYANFQYEKVKEVVAETRIARSIETMDHLLEKNAYHEFLRCSHPSYPSRKTLTIKGEHWDIVVPDDYPSIQSAVNAADIGYRIFVRSGIYHENVVINKDGITLHGENKENTIIDGGGIGNVVKITASYVNVSGFTIQNSGHSGAGIKFHASSGNQIQDNKIVNNDIGLWLYRSHANNITNNLISNNKHGLFLNYSSLANIITNNEIKNNRLNGVLFDEASRGNLIAGNHIEGNEIGIKITNGSDGNMIHHNSFINNKEYNAFDSSSNTWDDNVGEGNYWDDYTGIDENGDGIGDTPYYIPGGDNEDRYPLMNPPIAQRYSIEKMVESLADDQKMEQHHKTVITSSGDTIVVPDDYPTIQEAIDHASDGDTILVKAGVYYENVLVYKSVNIIGENKFTTFVDGMGSGHIFTITADNVLISSFTIRNTNMGSAGIRIESNQVTIMDNIIRDCGDGVHLSFSQYSTVENNTLTNNNFGVYVHLSSNSKITNNKIELNNDGIAVWSSSKVTVESNWIENNNYTGVLHLWSNDDEIDGNIIAKNKDTGIQMFSSCGNVIEWNNIKNNSHDGISSYKSSNNSIRNNIILRNPLGVSFWFYSSCNTIAGNNITNNNWDGIWLEFSSDNNTIAGNNITNNNWDGILLRCSSGNTITGNNIINNNRDGIELLYSSGNTITGNNIMNNSEGISLGDWGCSSDNNTITKNNIINNNLGICLSYSSNNTITKNNITNSYEGIWLVVSSDNTITKNNIKNNFCGIELSQSSSNNIIHNNFIYNIRHATFHNSLFNRWNENYWNNWRLPFPKPILGTIIGAIPWLNFDWHPARKPYNMEV